MKVRKAKKPAIRRAVDEVAGTLNFTSYLARRPAQYSGGQRQRVALGRAMLASRRCLVPPTLPPGRALPAGSSDADVGLRPEGVYLAAEAPLLPRRLNGALEIA